MSPLPDTAPPSKSAPGTVGQRIDARTQALQRFYIEGVPERARPHLSSLTRLREWNDPELGIHPIGSPNDFTTTHVTWGEKVVTIKALAAGLAPASSASSSPLARSSDPDGAQATTSRRAHAQQLAKVASQYVSERDRANRLQIELDAARREIERLERRMRRDEEGEGK